MAMAVRLGVVGCGSFGCFAVEAVTPSPRVELVAVADPRPEWRGRAASIWAAKRGGQVRQYEKGEELCGDAAVDLVWVLAPPFLHYPLARLALSQGKAVFLEKPGSLKPEEIEELEREAEARGLPVSVDLVLRRTPVAGLVREIIASGALGGVERIALENVAHDESLPAGHWFWDMSHSGGIFVEHGVHFFDLATWWCGPGEVQAALALRREPAALAPGRAPAKKPKAPIDRVLAVALHYPPAAPQAVVATYYHSFTTVKRFERARWQLVLHRGFLDVEGWIPIGVHGQVLVAEDEEQWLRELLRCRLEPLEQAAPDRDVPWKEKEGPVCRRRVRVDLETPDRMYLYQRAIREGLEDVAACLTEPGRRPAVALADVGRALEMAAHATSLLGGQKDGPKR